MSNPKKTFVFNFEWYEILKDYPAEIRLEVYEAVIVYAASGTLPELKPLSRMAFSFIKKEIDCYNEPDSTASFLKKISLCRKNHS